MGMVLVLKPHCTFLSFRATYYREITHKPAHTLKFLRIKDQLLSRGSLLHFGRQQTLWGTQSFLTGNLKKSTFGLKGLAGRWRSPTEACTMIHLHVDKHVRWDLNFDSKHHAKRRYAVLISRSGLISMQCLTDESAVQSWCESESKWQLIAIIDSQVWLGY